ncbi:F-box domain-containing protein [Pseudoscourfieldia marina]
MRQLLLHRDSRRSVKAVFLAHFPVQENGGVPASPLASTARSMAFLRDTMGVSDANAVCVDLWPHILDANKGGPSANAELNATAKAQDALDSYARCVCEVVARLAAGLLTRISH